ncbi:alpha/beta-Hydrolases superfamily protein [Perilla frutescens var. hirtella]|uniref:Alpha/beta-Hydrolases superfamily protein n=1 Tax=Perilla frutescens var. hirtella TaxID=608512 RepID=A0AAD4IPD0_PERFH|nr:alpha/beta-Hydrolases superfamily protein [Perilla frutescens var. hirtella]
MAGTLSQIPSPTARDGGGLRRSFSTKDLHRRGLMRRSYSDNHLSQRITSIRASLVQPKLNNSRSHAGLFNIHLSGAVIPDSLKSFLFDPETSKEMDMEGVDHDHEIEIHEGKKRGNWIEMIVELRNKWKLGKQHDTVESSYVGGDGEGCDGEGGCDVEYDEDEDGKEISIDREAFSSMLSKVSWSDTKLFAQMAFLCNMAYVIPDMKTEDLRRHYGLEFVTSSMEKKAAAAAIRDRVAVASSSSSSSLENEEAENTEQKSRVCSSTTAYEIAASAASYVQSRAKDLIALGSEPQLSEEGMMLLDAEENESSSPRMHKSERVAACVAASTMTALVAAGEKQKEKAAKDLQSLHSAPCEWFVCDDSDIYTRCFVIQGSDSLASWQANLFFEPIKFEGTNVLVHRGIYEAAKGIYDQFMPEIKEHLKRFGERAKLQFTGHSLGGSLALLVNLMLLTRKEVKHQNLLPVVTFGSPFVFCGGHKILEQLGLDENHVRCVMMHRDIVPRAFSCNYPNYVAQLLKRLSGTFRYHPCLNKNKLLYTPMGKIFILQPHEKSSPAHPLLPAGSALYELQNANTSLSKSGFREFLNSPHPLETLSDPTAYGSEGTIIRDHDSSNYLKAVHEVIRQHSRVYVRKARLERNQMWPLLTSRSPHAWSHTCNIDGREEVNKKVLTGV